MPAVQVQEVKVSQTVSADDPDSLLITLLSDSTVFQTHGYSHLERLRQPDPAVFLRRLRLSFVSFSSSPLVSLGCQITVPQTIGLGEGNCGLLAV